MSLNGRNIINLFSDDKFLETYGEYQSNNYKLKEMIEFLNSLDINKSYYKLNIIHTLPELKIKTINGYLNKLTNKNYDEIVSNIKNEIKNDVKLIDITITCLFEKCILQKYYMTSYVNILLELNNIYDIKSNILKEVILYKQLFEKQETETIKEKYKEKYIFLCDKNKLADNYICFCETIYHLEKKQLIENMYDKMIKTFLDKIDICLQKNPINTKDIYKYISCMENIYSKINNCPLEIKKKLQNIQSKIVDKKIIFKIMNILELNESVL
jgi:hypothetical protein